MTSSDNMASSALASVSKDDIICLDFGDDTTVKIHRYGATIVSWTKQGEELLFLSSKAVLDGTKAIRGGIPVVFPNFGPWDLGPAHGLARISYWNIKQAPTKDEKGDVSVLLSLEDSDRTRAMWSHKFCIDYKITLKTDELQMDFSVQNTGQDSFSFTCLLHTYFNVTDVTTLSISNLTGLKFIDKVRGGETFTEDRDLVTISENVDSVYMVTPPDHTVTNVSTGRNIVLTKNNFPDTVVWNPWKEKAAAMSDLGDEDYVRMVCVEAGHVSEPVTLSPSKTYSASQTLTVKTSD